MNVNGKASSGASKPERFAGSSPDQIVWVLKSDAHLAAEAVLAAQQAAERDTDEASEAHAAKRR